MSKDIVFINPLSFKENGALLCVPPPLGLVSLATVVKNNGYEGLIIDLNQPVFYKTLSYSSDQGDNLSKIIDYLVAQSSKIYAFYTMCNNYHEVLYMAKKIKETVPDSRILLGGPHATLTAKETLTDFFFIDAIGIGEGEETILSMIDLLCGYEKNRTPKGVLYRDKNTNAIIGEVSDHMVENLDTLPHLDYSLIDMNGVQSINIEVGRGCPFSCTFCSTKNFWKRKSRVKSIDRIIDEIKHLQNTFGISDFVFTHDLFTLNKAHVLEFCERLVKEQLTITWSCQSRVDTIDKEMITAFKNAGCTSIFFGIETGSAHMQKKISKNLNLDRVYEIIQFTKQNKIQAICSFIYGFPQESIEDLNDTLKMIYKLMQLKAYKVQLFHLAILPGTEIFSVNKSNLKFCGNLSSICKTNWQDSEVDGWIKSHKDIFPQYYMLKDYPYEDNIHLEQFVDGFLTTVVSRYPTLTTLLVKAYTNDFVTLYQDMLKRFKAEFFIQGKFKAYASREALLNVFIELLPRKNALYTERIIKNLFHFEDCLHQLSKLDISSQEQYDYDIDVLKLKLAVDQGVYTVEHLELKPVSLQMNKSSKNSLKINYVL